MPDVSVVNILAIGATVILGPWANPENKNIKRSGKDTEHISNPLKITCSRHTSKFCSASSENHSSIRNRVPQLSKSLD